MTSDEMMTMMTIVLAQHLSSFSHIFFPSIGGHRLLLSLCTRLYKRTHGTYSLSHTTNTYIDTTHSVALSFTHVTHPLHTCLTLTLTQDGHAYTSKNFFNLTFQGVRLSHPRDSRVTPGELDVRYLGNEASTYHNRIRDSQRDSKATRSCQCIFTFLSRVAFERCESRRSSMDERPCGFLSNIPERSPVLGTFPSFFEPATDSILCYLTVRESEYQDLERSHKSDS